MSITFNYNSFEILLTKQKDSVTIRCLDKELFKIYQEVYNDMTISELCPIGINNFYEICKSSLDALQKNESDGNISVIFTCNERNVKINIDYKLQLHFAFSIKLPLTEHAQMSGQDLYIKKLEKRVEQLCEFIDDNMMIRACQYTSQVTSNGGHHVYFQNYAFLPINCNSITLQLENSDHIYDYTNRNFTLKFHPNNPNKTDGLLPQFKIIKCKLLTLSGELHDFGYENLSETIEKIHVINHSIINFITRIKKSALPNLHTIDFANGNCSPLTQEIVDSLKIKKLRVANRCTNFNVTRSNNCQIERY
jgi:hypothetical protein